MRENDGVGAAARPTVANAGAQREASTGGTPEKDLENKGETWKALVVIALVVVALLVGYAWAVQRFVGEGEKGGLFGDMFGGANALFSGLAFAGLIYTIFLQRRELELQRDELRLTRKEVAKQAEQMAAQTTTFNRQQFDSTFFQLLHLQSSIVASLEFRWDEEVYHGRRVFAFAKDQLSTVLPRQKVAQGGNLHIAVANSYHQVDRGTGGILGHYFRNLYHIVKFVDGAAIGEGDKKLYTSFARAQLSEDETVALFFNGQTQRAAKFKPLIEKYALLEYFPRMGLAGTEQRDIEAELHGHRVILAGTDLTLYDAGAYGDDTDLLRRRDGK